MVVIPTQEVVAIPNGSALASTKAITSVERDDCPGINGQSELGIYGAFAL